MLASETAVESFASLHGFVYSPSLYALCPMLDWLQNYLLCGVFCDTYSTCVYELHNHNELLFTLHLLGADVMVFILIYASGAGKLVEIGIG